MAAGVERGPHSGLWLLLLGLFLLQPAAAFGAGNIASISRIEGINWRHGDIEDMLKTVAFLKGSKWTSMMVKRVYFGNWLRDYSQAMDVGALKQAQAESIRILVWVLGFLTFGYATEEFEVTSERLGVYRAEEHIDNPKDYADNEDARKYDPRLRPPVQPIELEIDSRTGMKNYIANENLDVATSIGYVKFSLTRSIHFGRMYTHGSERRGKDEDLYEALRCLGQSLHCLEDFGAHTNYVELSLRELGYRNVFPHTGVSTEIDLHGRRVYPLVTGVRMLLDAMVSSANQYKTFGMVDFIHSVLGEATDHFTQSEVEELNKTLADAQASGGSDRSTIGSNSQMSTVISLLAQIPGSGNLAREAEELQAQSSEQERINEATRATEPNFAGDAQAIGGMQGSDTATNMQNMAANIDPVATAKKIYPILVFRDKIAKAVASTIEKIPGLESLVEKISETITLFVLSLLAPFVRPIIALVTKSMKSGSFTVVEASGKAQYEPWTDPYCSDPTHSLLSKDHFSNILNEPAGQVASAILQYTAPRVIYAWEHPEVPVEQVLNDVTRTFHHPAIRDRNCELHNKMFAVVERWSRETHHQIDTILSSESVRRGDNHLETTQQAESHGQHHGGLGAFGGGSGPGGFQVPTTQTLGNLLSQAASSRFGSGTAGMFSKVGKMAGVSRGGEDLDLEAEAAQVGREYPGTQTAFDTTRAPTGPEFSGQPQLQPQPPYAAETDPYRGSSPAPPRQEFYGYGPPPAPGQYQGGYQGGAPQGPYPGGPPMGYPSGQGWGYDPNAPPPGGYGYGNHPGPGYY